MKKTILSLILLSAGCLSASAQEANTKEVFNPHWYVQGQIGAQHTLGEVKFGKLISPNAQIGVGYNFNYVWGARLTVGAWQSKAGVNFDYKNTPYEYNWKWNYAAPTLNATFNVTNAIFGYNPNRIVDFTVFAGAGANIAWGNDEAGAAKTAIKAINPSLTSNDVEFLQHYWDGTKVRAVGQFGGSVDFKVCEKVSVGLEVNCNLLSDKYNSKKAPNVDWYFNALAGVKVALGKTSKRVPVPVVPPVEKTVYVDRYVTVHDTVEVSKKFAPEPLRRDIFFTICNSEVSKAEMPKVEDIAEYMNRYPQAKVSITGYADKGTGNAKGNEKYARNRAEMVAELLKSKFGISADRIIVDSKGDTVQPFDINDLNRVSICVAK